MVEKHYIAFIGILARDWIIRKNMIRLTLFVFMDGLSQHISALIESMFNCWGLLPNYIGGGAGSLTFERKSCVFTGEGLLKDAAVFALADIKSGVGVAHGWKPVTGPLKVTEADRNTIISLNWRPAFEVYRETVEKISGKSFDNTDFFQLAKGFPFLWTVFPGFSFSSLILMKN
jgi:hypothetical protein